MRNETAVVGVYGHLHAARIAGRALRAVAGPRDRAAMVVHDERGRQRVRRRADASMLDDEPDLDLLQGQVALAELSLLPEAEWTEPLADKTPATRPAAGRIALGPAAVAVSGGFVGSEALVARLLSEGALLRGDGPDELVLQLMAGARQRTPINGLVDALWRVRGGFALVAALSGALVGVRDPRGLHTLYVGRVEEATVLASDLAMLLAVGAAVERELAPGEMLVIEGGRAQSVHPFPARETARCLLSAVRMQHSSARAGAASLWEIRRRLGMAIAEWAPCLADIAVGFRAHEVLVAAHAERGSLPWMTLEGVVAEAIRGRDVVLVHPGGGIAEPIQEAVARLLALGAERVHLRLGLPLARHACPYGVELPVSDVHRERAMRPEDLAAWLGLATAGWLPAAKLEELLETTGQGWCRGCSTGVFPEVAEREDQLGLFAEGHDEA